MATTYNHYDQKNMAAAERTTGKTIAQKVCIALGVFSLFVGLIGFVAPDFLGLHLSFVNNILHLALGALSIWVGLAANPMSAYRFSVWFGSFYALVGIAGFVLGEIGLPSVGSLAEDRFLWRILPGSLEFGAADHIAHIVLGVIFLATAFAWKRAQVSVPANQYSTHSDVYGMNASEQRTRERIYSSANASESYRSPYGASITPATPDLASGVNSGLSLDKDALDKNVADLNPRKNEDKIARI